MEKQTMKNEKKIVKNNNNTLAQIQSTRYVHFICNTNRRRCCTLLQARCHKPMARQWHQLGHQCTGIGICPTASHSHLAMEYGH